MSVKRGGDDLWLAAMTALPCAGKSAIAYGVAEAMGWPVFSVDPIDAAMRGEGVDADTAGSAPTESPRRWRLSNSASASRW
ncbi:MAG: hypothetical protein ACREEW_07360 [Caulobacteraceae bacterium]